MTKTVFVTGASGYIAAHIVEQLLVTTTYTVRGSVRSVSSTSKIAHLTSLPHATERLQLVEADHYSKVRAEKAAWNFMEKDENRDKFRLVVINPHVVIGPSHTKAVNTSLLIIQEILTGKFPGIIDINFGFVDVRDVAKAHILAMENPDARGRYVCFAEPKHVKQVIEVLKREFPGYSYPWLNIPNMIVYLASYLYH